MDAVVDSHEEKEVSEVQKLTSGKKRLKKHILKEAKAMRKSRSNYYEQKTLFDYALEDAGLLQGFFSKLLDFQTFKLDNVVTACTFFMVHSDSEMDAKDKLCKELNQLLDFRIELASFQNLVEEKEFYYSELWNKLTDIKKYRDTK